MIERIEPTNRLERSTACSDPRIGVRVYDYYNGALEPEDVRAFEQHLIQCSHCEKVVLELDHIYFSLEDAESERNQNPDASGQDRLRVEQIQRVWRKRS
ncbi:MAG: zf-HC2 domain-containing protein [Acidobacteriota bacterium]|jgi:anti-sigma factor RsiW